MAERDISGWLREQMKSSERGAYRVECHDCSDLRRTVSLAEAMKLRETHIGKKYRHHVEIDPTSLRHLYH